MLFVCLSHKQWVENGQNCSWHDFASSIIMSRISALCLYGAIYLCTKHMAGFLASSESSPSPKQMEFHGKFLSKWNFLGILFGGLLARIAEYALNGILRLAKFHKHLLKTSRCGIQRYSEQISQPSFLLSVSFILTSLLRSISHLRIWYSIYCLLFMRSWL